MVLQSLTGEVPFNGADVGKFNSDREIDVAGQIPRAVSRNRHLRDLILALLRLDPEDRPDFASFSRHPFLKGTVWFASPHVHSMPCGGDSVTSLCFDASHLVCGTESGLILLFDRRTFCLTRTLDFHRKTVSALAMNRDIIISGSQVGAGSM